MRKKNSRMRFSFKLFICVTPLIIVSFFLVALLSYKLSADTVTDISRKKLLVEAESSAYSIEMIFRVCEKDLEILWQFFFEQSFDTANINNYGANLQKFVPVLQKFRNSSPMYLQVGFWNFFGSRIISSDADVILQDYLTLEERRAILESAKISGMGFSHYKSPVSHIFYSQRHGGYVVTVHKAFYDDFGVLIGSLMVDLDFDRLAELISPKIIDHDGQGFAFLVDQNGETIFHPHYEPYSARFTQYRDPVMRELIIYTTLGRSGFRVYTAAETGEENMAAYAPIQTAGWTLVKTVPLTEFTQSASMLRAYIIHIGVIILICAIIILYFLAYRLNQPVLRLARASRQLAAGSLDVSELKISGTAETAQMTKDFNIMARNLKRIQEELVAAEKMSSLGLLSAGVAHELRNPLNAIKLSFLYLERHRLEETLFGETCDMIYQEIERLDKFVNNFLYFAKESPPVKEECDIMDILNKIVCLNREQAQAGNIKVTLTSDGPLPLLLLDAHQCMQVFINLYNNAVQAMPHGGELSINVSHDLDADGRFGIKIVFLDTGAGIKDAALKNIFDPFFTTKKRGAGLGLAISRAIIESHNGVINIFNRNNGPGAAAEIFIPVNN